MDRQGEGNGGREDWANEQINNRREKKHLKACKQRPNASFDPKALVSFFCCRFEPHSEHCCLGGLRARETELANEHTGRVCLVVLLSAILKNIATKRPGREVNSSCQKKIFQSGLIAQGEGASWSSLEMGFFFFCLFHNVSTNVPVT